MAWTKTVWRRISHILSSEGATPRVSRLFFKTVIQAVLLFGEETWVVTPRMGLALGGELYPGGETADRTAPTENNGQDVEIHLGSGGKGGGGFLNDGGIRQAAPEHGCTVYHYRITVRPV